MKSSTVYGVRLEPSKRLAVGNNGYATFFTFKGAVAFKNDLKANGIPGKVVRVYVQWETP